MSPRPHALSFYLEDTFERIVILETITYGRDHPKENLELPFSLLNMDNKARCEKFSGLSLTPREGLNFHI